MIERMFENTLWATRFMVVLAVIFGLIGAVILFVVASVDIFVTAKYRSEERRVGKECRL